MSDLLELPIDATCKLNNASYKNPARLVIRSREDRTGWRAYYCLADGRHWYLATIEQTAQGTAIVFSAGSGNALGVNQRLADESGEVSAREIHDAEHFYVFAVSPDGRHRSLVHEFHNDKYLPASGNSGPPWKLDGYGWPVKDKRHRGIFRRVMDFPPEYEAGGTPPPLPPPPPPPDDDPDEPPDPPDPGDEPATLIEIVREERARYDTPMRDPEMGELLNAVAWQARAAGWGLAHKPTGTHTLQPRTGIRVSRDLLIHKATQRTYDVLADVEGEARPTWNHVETGILDWVAPVEPDGVEPEPEPDPDPEPTPEITHLSYPAEVAAGEAFTVAWETEHAEHVELLADGAARDIRPANGSVVRAITETTEWTIRAVRGELTAEDGFIVRVRQPAPPPPPPDPPPPPPPEPDPPPPPPRSWWEILRDLIRQLTGGGS
jgi:hypothetical protein